MRSGTFFEASRLPIEKIVWILHSCLQNPVGKMMVEAEICNKTAIDRYNFARDVCTQYFIDHPAIIGGPGVKIETDDSKFGRHKYNRGRVVDGHWVFGGMQRISGKCFLDEVKHRDAATLLPIIQQCI